MDVDVPLFDVVVGFGVTAFAAAAAASFAEIDLPRRRMAPAHQLKAAELGRERRSRHFSHQTLEISYIFNDTLRNSIRHGVTPPARLAPGACLDFGVFADTFLERSLVLKPRFF